MSAADRDRDATGRARNSRPRDATGRPLPRGEHGVPRVPEDADLTPSQALAQAQQFLDDDLPFQAHEVFEAMWKQRRDGGFDDAGMWQGLAQIAVGLTHVQRGNTTGAASLLRRGAATLDAAAAAPEVATVELARWAERVAEHVAEQPAARPPRLRR
jgi:uncharacterized protein